MEFDLSKLRGKITEVFNKQYIFAKQMGWSERTCSLKLSGKVYWKQDEISRACELLGLSDEDIRPFFFTENVQCG